jgi:hypothetical protein
MEIIQYSLNHYWAHRGHQSFGLGMKDISDNVYYICIPKNASSMIRKELSVTGWRYELFDEHPIDPGKKIIIVLRDPIQRWVSGITEFLVLYHKNITTLPKELLQVLCTSVTLDDHTEKQVYFLNGLPKSQCVFFKFGPNLGRNLAHFFESRALKTNFSNDNVVYSTAEDLVHLNYKEQVLTFLQQNPQYLQSIKRHYEEDFTFIKQVQYYGIN